jgi:hypothetical protein
MLMLVPMGQTGGGSIYEQEISKVCDRRNSKLISSDTFMRNEMKHEGARTQAISQVILGDGVFYAKKQPQFVCEGIWVYALLVVDLYPLKPDSTRVERMLFHFYILSELIFQKLSQVLVF